MPAKWPDYKYNLYSFTAKEDQIQLELSALKITYKSVVSITYIGHALFVVFYGLKEY